MTSILENLSYRQELLLKLNCNGVLSKKIESVRYTKNALKKLFVKYNSCENTTYTMIKPRRDFFTLGLKGSIAAQRFDLENNSVDANLEKFGYRIGVESEFLLPFNNQKWAIIFEPTYQSFNAVDTFPHKSGFGIYRVGLDYQAVDLPLGVRYYFLSGKHSKVYANIFAAQSLTFNSAFYLNNLPVFTIPDIAFTAGLGYKYNNLASVELRWNLPHSLKATLTSTKTTYSNVMLTFGFHFL